MTVESDPVPVIASDICPEEPIATGEGIPLFMYHLAMLGSVNALLLGYLRWTFGHVLRQDLGWILGLCASDIFIGTSLFGGSYYAYKHRKPGIQLIFFSAGCIGITLSFMARTAELYDYMRLPYP